MFEKSIWDDMFAERDKAFGDRSSQSQEKLPLDGGIAFSALCMRPVKSSRYPCMLKKNHILGCVAYDGRRAE